MRVLLHVSHCTLSIGAQILQLQNMGADADNSGYFDGAPGLVGQRVIETLDAMYRSAKSGGVEAI